MADDAEDGLEALPPASALAISSSHEADPSAELNHFVRIVYFGAPQIVVDPFSGGISGTTHVQVLNAMDLAVTHQSAICVGSA